MIIFRWKRAICNVYRTIELFAHFDSKKLCVNYPLISLRTKTNYLRGATTGKYYLHCNSLGILSKHQLSSSITMECGPRKDARYKSHFLSNRNYQLLNASSLSSRILTFVSSGVDKTRKYTGTIGGKRSEQLLKERLNRNRNWKEISVCDLFRNNRLLVEMRGEKEREKKRLLRHTKRHGGSSQSSACTCLRLTGSRVTLFPASGCASPCLCIRSPVHYHARNRKTLPPPLSTWRVISTPGKRVRQRSTCAVAALEIRVGQDFARKIIETFS